jgi:hypothetical protein
MQWGVITPRCIPQRRDFTLRCNMQRGDLTPAAYSIAERFDFPLQNTAVRLDCIIQQGVNLQFKELHEIEIKLDKI